MSNIVEFVNNQVSLFEGANDTQSVSWAKESQFAIQLFQANDFLANTALSNPTSAQNAIVNVAAIGITLNPAQKLAYLVPRKRSVCLDISYMGLLHIAMETGSIRWGQAVLVHSNDTFKLIGLGNLPTHEHNPFGERGEIVGVYCTVKTSDGDFLTECMSKDEVYKIRSRSESFKKNMGPWATDEMEMWRKTVIKRAYKYWPKVERLSNAIEVLNQGGEGIEMEPVMQHASNDEKEVNKLEDIQKLNLDVSSWCEQMGMCENIESLKGVFSTAYTNTKIHNEQNQKVQAAYAENKSRLGA